MGSQSLIGSTDWGGGILLALSFDLFGSFLVRHFPLGLWLLPSRYKPDSFRWHGAVGDKPERLDGRIWSVCWCEKNQWKRVATDYVTSWCKLAAAV